jgi:hypothetical protein
MSIEQIPVNDVKIPHHRLYSRLNGLVLEGFNSSIESDGQLEPIVVFRDQDEVLWCALLCRKGGSDLMNNEEVEGASKEGHRIVPYRKRVLPASPLNHFMRENSKLPSRKHTMYQRNATRMPTRKALPRPIHLRSKRRPAKQTACALGGEINGKSE